MTTHRERLLGQARADLTALPDLADTLARLIADRMNHDVSDYQAKVVGSPAPLSIPVVHLTDTRHKPGWHGHDPRYPTWVLTWGRDPATGQPLHRRLYATRQIADNSKTRLPEANQQDAHIHQWGTADQYGIAPTLETWVRIVSDEMPGPHQLTTDEAWVKERWRSELPGVLDLTETATVRSEATTLLEHWDFVTAQPWAVVLAEDVTRLAATVRAQLGIRPEPEYTCPQCGNPAYLQPGGILACTEVPDHHIVVRNLEAQQRRRPAITTGEVHAEFGVQPGTLRQWKLRRKIKPARTEHGRNWWFPWDVFCLLNPDIAEAIQLRDQVEAG